MKKFILTERELHNMFFAGYNLGANSGGGMLPKYSATDGFNAALAGKPLEKGDGYFEHNIQEISDEEYKNLLKQSI